MKKSVLVTGVLALALPACASLNSYIESRADTRFNAGMAAYERGDYRAANRDLGWVVENYGSEPIGQRALLAVAAMEMDPRNPARRLSVGADLISAYLRREQEQHWVLPVAQTMYLLALEMGAAEERVAQAEAEKEEAERRIAEVARALPTLPDSAATVPTRLKAIQDERDRLARRVDQLEAQVVERDKKLVEKDKELERIRKTLKS